MALYGAIDSGHGWTYGNDPEQNNEAATGEWR